MDNQKIYYKGYLGKTNDVIKSGTSEIGSRDIGSGMITMASFDFIRIQDIYWKLNNYILKMKKDKFIVKDKEIIEYFNNCFTRVSRCEYYLDFSKPIEIIFELFEDNENQLYAKEIISGLVFPIIKPSNFKNIYTIKCKKDRYGPREKYRYFLHYITKIYNPKIEEIHSCLNAVDISKVSKKEVNKYLNDHKGLLKVPLFISKLERLNKLNIIKKKFKLTLCDEVESDIRMPIQEVKRELKKESKESSLIASIMLLLKQIRISNPDIYQEQLKKFNIIKGNQDVLTLTPLTTTTLEQFKINLEMIIYCTEKNPTNILEYLNEIKNQYENNFKEERFITIIPLSTLDSITEAILSQKFSIEDENEILNILAYLYLYEVYVKDNPNLNYLENSYFKSIYLERVMSSLYDLEYEDKIEDNIMIDLNQEISIQNIIKLIKELRFKKDKVKKLKK